MTNGLGGSWSTRWILGTRSLPVAGTDFGDAGGVSATSTTWGEQGAPHPNRREIHALQSISLTAARQAWRHKWSSACHGHPNYTSQAHRLSTVKSTQPTQTHTQQLPTPWPNWHSWTLQLHILTALDHSGPKFGIQCWEYSPAVLGMTWAQLCGWASATRTSNCYLINIKLG